jgi:hypothetical protein
MIHLVNTQMMVGLMAGGATQPLELPQILEHLQKACARLTSGKLRRNERIEMNADLLDAQAL